MAKMQLSETLIYQGRMYGPGDVELPDDPALLERARFFEEQAQVRNREALAVGLQMLPSGHPYRQMFPVVNAQPPEFDGDPSPVSNAAFNAPLLNSNSLMPAGFSVSGIGPDGKPLAGAGERGEQFATQFAPNGEIMGVTGFRTPTSTGAGEANAPQGSAAEVNGIRMAPSETPKPAHDVEQQPGVHTGQQLGLAPNGAPVVDAKPAAQTVTTQQSSGGGDNKPRSKS